MKLIISIERAMNLSELLNNSLALLFIILFLGSLLGEIKVKGLSLGSAGVLLVALIFGHFGYEISPVIQNIGLSLFIVSVGLQAGPRFFRMLRSKGLVFAILSIFVILAGSVSTFVVARLFDIDPALAVGLYTGALTSTPGLAAALEASQNPVASIGYGIAYPYGLVAVVLFVQLVPKVLKIDLKKDLEQTRVKRDENSPVVTTVEIMNPSLHKQAIYELPFFNKSSVVISRVIRNKRSIIPVRDTVLLQGDKLLLVGAPSDIDAMCKNFGKKVENDFKNIDNIQSRKIIVESEEVAGKSLKELDLRKRFGVNITRIERDGIEYSQNSSLPLEIGDVLTVVSNETRLNEAEKFLSKRTFKMSNLDILSLSLILLIGVALGMIPIYIPGLGTITLGLAGGPLFAALIVGHFGKIGSVRARFYPPANKAIGDIGLVLFLAGAGTKAGNGLLEILKNEGLTLFIAGAVITTVPLFVGYFLARKFMRLNMAHTMGALCGGMTSTPGLGAVNQLFRSEEPAIAYAAAYPFALVLMAITSQLLILIL